MILYRVGDELAMEPDDWIDKLLASGALVPVELEPCHVRRTLHKTDYPCNREPHYWFPADIQLVWQENPDGSLKWVTVMAGDKELTTLESGPGNPDA